MILFNRLFMRYTKEISSIVFLAVSVLISHAQHLPGNKYDEGFLLNPAYCGLTGECSLRAGFYYSNQWEGNFVSNSFQADIRLRPTNSKGSSFGIGLSAGNQKSPNDLINKNIAGISFAYHKQINQLLVHLGTSVLWQQKKLNTNDFQFASQWSRGNFDPSVPSGETGISETASSVALNTGAIAELIIPDFPIKNLRAGISGHYLNQPYESFTESSYHYTIATLLHFDCEIYIAPVLSLIPYYTSYSGQTESLVIYGGGLHLDIIKKHNHFRLIAGAGIQSKPYKAIRMNTGIGFQNFNVNAWYSLYSEGVIPDYMNYGIAGFSVTYNGLCFVGKNKKSCLMPDAEYYKRNRKWKR